MDTNSKIELQVMLELCVFTLCPEVKSEKITEKVKEMRKARQAKRGLGQEQFNGRYKFNSSYKQLQGIFKGVNNNYGQRYYNKIFNNI